MQQAGLISFLLLALALPARAAEPWQDPQWLRLGHYRPKLTGGYESQADGPGFFLAPDGARNPKAEYEATLEGLRKGGDVVCKFPARAMYLASKGALTSMPEPSCPKLESFLRRVQPEAATIVFSSYYLNNPASAFGHTFLRIRKAGATAGHELLDYGVDYSATSDTNNPVLYAFKGIFGFFPGFFHIFPYYYKVREYNDYESRDLWEYDLSLSPQQVLMLVLHVWELGSTYFDYYYIDENCSYHVLAALEAVAPELHLLDRVKLPVIPADTVKALESNPGLVQKVTYRASAMTQFLTRIAPLSHEQRDAVESLSRNAEAAVPGVPEQQARVLDAAADLIDVRYAKDLPFEPDGVGGKLKRRVLERRASLGLVSPPLEVTPPLDKRPDIGHGSGRISAASGWSSTQGPSVALSYRLALHDLEDPPQGYPELAQIEFLPIQLRAYRDGVQLESADFVNAVSLHSMSAFDQRLSWRVELGVHRIRDGGCDACLAGIFDIGSGFTATAGPLTMFALGDVTAEASGALRGIEQMHALRLGIGPSAGLRLHLGDSGVAMISGGFRWLPDAFVSTTWQAEASLRWQANPGVAIGLSGRQYVDAREGAAELFFYF